jgi:Na+-driven multidrug efflux pump
VGNIVIQSVINSFGTGVMAGYSASIKLNNLVITSFTTLGNGISNYTAQNIGAGLRERIRPGFKAGVKLVWIICVPIILLYMLFAKALVNFFMNTPSDMALQSGMTFLHIVTPFYLIVSVKLVADGILRGSGLMKYFMISTFTDLILRVVLAEVLSIPFQSTGIWCAWPIGWTIAMVMSVMFYRKAYKDA